MRKSTVITLVFVVLAATAHAQQPTLHPLGNGYECNVTQTLEGDTLNLSCVEVDSPLAAGFDYEIYDIERYEPSISDGHWLQFKLRTNTDLLQVLLEYTFYPPGDSYGIVEDSIYDSDLENLRRGQRVSVTVIPDVLGPDVQWDRVRIESKDGFRCKGCGTYSASTLQSSSEIDFRSLSPGDINIVIEELSNRLMGARRR